MSEVNFLWRLNFASFACLSKYLFTNASRAIKLVQYTLKHENFAASKFCKFVVSMRNPQN